MEVNTLINVVLFLLYSSTFFYLSWYIYNHTKEGWNLESFFLAMFLLFYIIIPMSFIINDNILLQAYQDKDIELYADEYSTYSFTSFSIMLIFLFFYFIGTRITSSRQHILEHVEERHLDFHLFKISLLKAIGIFLSILSFVSMFIYSSQFGGFEQAIYYANWVNSGYVDEAALTTKYIFVIRFIHLSIISFVIYIFIKEKSNLFYIIFLLIIPLGTTIFSKVFLFSGKQLMIELFLLLIFYKSIKEKSSYIFPIALFTLILYFTIPVMDTLINSRQDLSNVTIEFFSIFQFLEYFTFPQIALEFALNKEYDFLFFYDFIYGLRGNFVPQSWLKEYAISTVEMNTFYFIKEYKAVVPPGILAFSYYSFGLLGIIVMGFLSGFIIKKLDSLFLGIQNINISFSIFYALFMTNIFTFVRTGVPRFNLYSTSTIVFILVMILSFKFYFKKTKISSAQR